MNAGERMFLRPSHALESEPILSVRGALDESSSAALFVAAGPLPNEFPDGSLHDAYVDLLTAKAVMIGPASSIGMLTATKRAWKGSSATAT